MTIKLTDMAKYYKAESHQKAAFDFIQSRLSRATLDEAARLYRTPVKEEKSSKASNDDPILVAVLKRCRELNIRLEKPTQGYNAYVVGLEGSNVDFSPNSDAPDAWNDAVFVLMLFSDGEVKRSSLFQCTTEPGRYYVRNRLNKRGAAFAQIDMLHKDVWQVGWHRDQKNCLVQSGAPITVVRDDNNSHGRSSTDPEQTGYFGINFHHAKGNYNPNSIGKWSAGCLVLPNPQQHQHLMGIIKKGSQSKTSYLLLSRKAMG